ncbi:Uncharacterised protein [Mycobacteroides abscessus subsp. abscessus]|nr:Uncharacterised protein [Mycobacteroides abscessus subsp. abscessus]
MELSTDCMTSRPIICSDQPRGFCRCSASRRPRRRMVRAHSRTLPVRPSGSIIAVPIRPMALLPLP